MFATGRSRRSKPSGFLRAGVEATCRMGLTKHRERAYRRRTCDCVKIKNRPHPATAASPISFEVVKPDNLGTSAFARGDDFLAGLRLVQNFQQHVDCLSSPRVSDSGRDRALGRGSQSQPLGAPRLYHASRGLPARPASELVDLRFELCSYLPTPKSRCSIELFRRPNIRCPAVVARTLGSTGAGG